MTDDNPGSAEQGEDRGRRFVSDSRSRFGIAWDELKGLIGTSERHKRLHGRLIDLLTASLVLDLVIAISLTYADSFSDKQGSSFGRAFGWTSLQMLVGGSSYPPNSGPAHVLEVVLQAYGIIVIAAIAGSFAAFFLSSDS